MSPVMRSHVRWARHYLLAQVVWSVRPCSFVCVTEGEEEIKKRRRRRNHIQNIIIIVVEEDQERESSYRVHR